MIDKRVTYLALGAFVFAVSCSKEAAEPDIFDWGDGKIYIRPSISDVSGSRSCDMTLDRLVSFQVNCFNYPNGSDGARGFDSPHFLDATFVRQSGSSAFATFVSSPNEEPHDWPSNAGYLRFFAFSPSLKEMDLDPTSLSALSGSFTLNGVRVNPDISSQFDLLTAEAAGDRWNDFAGGVDLSFGHRLCQVELKAWGASTEYDFEIAGVRIGNPVVEDTFVFADDSSPASSWKWKGEGTKDKVEYIFRSQTVSDSQDRIIRIDTNGHNTAESAASIMGEGGCAMVIPTFNTRWEGISDKNIGNEPYHTDRMYFSVLLRVSDRGTESTVYPYPGNPYGMTVISYAVDKSGNILRRLYAGGREGTYFTDEQLQHPYAAAEGEDIKDFGWAAVPVDADWSAGRKYIYTLDYSEGIGLHDPEDPEPGRPIQGRSAISWGVSVGNWNYAQKDENYNPDLEVP